MSRIVPLWCSDELSVHRFDHPPEHEDQPYETVATAFAASFVENGTFDLDTGEARWRLAPGDVLLRHPRMRYRASFAGAGFTDTCLTLTYRPATHGGCDDAPRSWARAGRPVLRASNRLRYLYWGLRRALDTGDAMLMEYCAVSMFADHGEPTSPLFSEHKLAWYAERVHAVRERLDAHFDREHSISELARSVGMSTFHFARVFAELVGRSPHRYLGEVRLRAAQSMLQQGRSVTETCYACGFRNLSHFTRRFARSYGVVPSRVGARRFARKCK